MQPWQVRKRLARLEQWTNRAAGLCSRSGEVEAQVRKEVKRLDDSVELVAQALQDEADIDRMAEKMAALEALGGQAEALCRERTEEDIATPVRKAHKELVRLKRQLLGNGER